jgi:hypothetical protein
MNNEPVAWIDPFDLERLPLYDCWVSGEKTKWVDIPLYTHPVKELKNIVVASATCSCGKVMEVTNLQPVKELTDEEIIAVGNAVVNHIDSNEGWIEFARAILRKAQEK